VLVGVDLTDISFHRAPPHLAGTWWVPGGLGQGTEILIGVLVATVRDPSGRAPTPDLSTAWRPKSDRRRGQPGPIFTPCVASDQRTWGLIPISASGPSERGVVARYPEAFAEEVNHHV
jgi:hypothetical protein